MNAFTYPKHYPSAGSSGSDDQLQSLQDLCVEHDRLMLEHRAAEAARVVRKAYVPPPPPAPAQPATALANDLVDAIADGARLIAQDVVAEERKRHTVEFEKLQGQVDQLQRQLAEALRHDKVTPLRVAKG